MIATMYALFLQLMRRRPIQFVNNDAPCLSLAGGAAKKKFAPVAIMASALCAWKGRFRRRMLLRPRRGETAADAGPNRNFFSERLSDFEFL